jgi:tripartite-type tricarboxylate transporter receptor subunit TctC
MFDPGPGLRHAKEGKLKLLAVGSPKRSSQVPDTPDAGRAGHDRLRRRHHLRRLCTGRHAGAVVAQLHDEVNKALARRRCRR